MFGLYEMAWLHVGCVFEGRHSGSTATRCGTTSVSTASHVLHQFTYHAGPDLGLYQVGEHLEIVSSRRNRPVAVGVDGTLLSRTRITLLRTLGSRRLSYVRTLSVRTLSYRYERSTGRDREGK